MFLDKERYLVGEPVYLNFEITNKGMEPVQFESGSSYSFCGGYQIEVSIGAPIENSSCATGFAGSCLSGGWVVNPGEARKDRVLLNYEHDLSKTGIYTIYASRTLNYGPPSKTFSDPGTLEQIKIEGEFQIQVEVGDDAMLAPIFQPFVADLESKDEERQREAARAIGSLAPAFLEDTILSMVNSRSTLPFAMLGLKHLNSARSREALANIIRNTSGYSYEKEQAIKDLSEMGDKKYFPLLLDEAKKWEPNQARDYVLAAAELGGDDALPYVISLLNSSNSFAQANGVMALGKTGSRQAVPLLIEFLRAEDEDIERLASSGLMQLTHGSPFENGQLYSDSPSRTYNDWWRWWAVHEDSAPIFKPTECGAVESLK